MQCRANACVAGTVRAAEPRHRKRGGQPGNRNAMKTGYRSAVMKAQRAEIRFFMHWTRCLAALGQQLALRMALEESKKRQTNVGVRERISEKATNECAAGDARRKIPHDVAVRVLTKAVLIDLGVPLPAGLRALSGDAVGPERCDLPGAAPQFGEDRVGVLPQQRRMKPQFRRRFREARGRHRLAQPPGRRMLRHRQRPVMRDLRIARHGAARQHDGMGHVLRFQTRPQLPRAP